MGDDWIGLPSQHDQYRDQHMSSSNSPNGGFMEERLVKLEYYQEAIKEALKNDTGLCKCCKESSLPVLSYIASMGICDDCLNTLGKLTNAVKNTNFLK